MPESSTVHGVIAQDGQKETLAKDSAVQQSQEPQPDDPQEPTRSQNPSDLTGQDVK